MKSPIAWLRGNKHRTEMLTGQDTRALLAIAACWDLYASSDDEGRAAAIGAVQHLLNAMQRKCWPMARELIARSLDWSDRDRLWPQVIEGDLLAAGETTEDGER